MSDASTDDHPPRPNGWDDVPGVVRAWLDVAIRLVVMVLVLLVLTWPGLFPFLSQFALDSGEVNILGSKFTIKQVGSLIPGVEIHNNQILLQGRDISTLPDSIDRLTTANSELQQANVALAAQLKSTGDLLADVTRQRDDVNRQLVALRQSVPSVQPLDTGAVDVRIEQQMRQTQQLAAAAVPGPAVPAVVPAASLLFGVAFSSDVGRDQATAEVRVARGVSDAPVGLFQREKYLRTVAAFASRDAAATLLPKYRSLRADAYIVDFRTWCPAAANIVLSGGDEPTVVDCRF